MSAVDLGRRGQWVAGLLLPLLALLAYANSFPGGYFLDDDVAVETNPLVSSPDIVKILFSDYWGPDINSGLHRPLVILSFALKHWLFGAEPFVDHLVNVLLHGLVAFLVFRLLLRWSLPAGQALLVAAIFAVHPIHTEVVNEAVGRAELLAALGVLLVLYVSRRASGRWRQPLLAGAFLVGLLSKENAIVALGLLPLVDGFLRAGSWRQWWRDGWRDYASLAATALAWMAFRIWGVARWVPKDGPDPIYTPLKLMAPLERILTALQIQWLYLWKQIFPADLRGIYSGSAYLLPVGDGLSLLSAVLVLASAAALVLALWLYAERRLAGLALLLYAVSFAPTANLFFATGATMAERLAYLPSLWFCLALVAVMVSLSRLVRREWVLVLLGVLVCSALTGRTLLRNVDFRDEVSLWEADTRNDPQNAMAWMYLGNQYWERRDLQKSEAAFTRALRAAPDFPEALSAYAAFLLERGRIDEGLNLALRSAEIGTAESPTLFMVIANLYIEKGNYAIARDWLDRARWLYAGDDYFKWLDGQVLEGLGDNESALSAYLSIVTALPQWDIWTRLSGVQLKLGRYAEAEKILRHALQSEDRAGYWNSLGVALAMQGRQGDARQAFARALGLAPDNQGYRQNYERLIRGEFGGQP